MLNAGGLDSMIIYPLCYHIVLGIGSNLGLKFGRERPISQALTDNAVMKGYYHIGLL